MNDIETRLRQAGRRPDGEAAEAMRAFAARAAEEDLVDVAYATVDSPLGPLIAAATPRGLVKISYGDYSSLDAVLEELSRKVSPRILEAPVRLDPVRRELEEYFERRRDRFDLPLDWALTKGFTQRVLRSTAAIPYGRVLTYTEVADQAGSPRGSRAAGNALGSNPIPIVVPCHRVVAAGHALGGYTGGTQRKEFLLELEGALGQLSL